MECPSILFADPNDHVSQFHPPLPQPDCFLDLHLDQIEAAVLGDEAGYGLESVFRQPLGSVGAIRHRQDVFRDMAKPGMRAGLERFAVAMCAVQRCLSHAALLSQPEQKRMWRLDAATRYCQANQALDALLHVGPPQNAPPHDGHPHDATSYDGSPHAVTAHGSGISSEALGSLSRWLHDLVGGNGFKSFSGACDTLSGRMRRIRYNMRCSEKMVYVGCDGGKMDEAYRMSRLICLENIKLDHTLSEVLWL